MDSQFLDAQEVEEYTGGLISRRKIYRLVSDRVIQPPVVARIGRSLVFNRQELDQWLRTGGAGFAGVWKKQASATTEDRAAQQRKRQPRST